MLASSFSIYWTVENEACPEAQFEIRMDRVSISPS